MRRDRLLKLADFLETVPRSAFNISDWQTKEPTKPEGKRQGECGFAGCAVGWAAHAKLFRGLKFQDNGFRHVPTFQGEEEWQAIGKLFDITNGGPMGTQEEAEYLFYGPRYPNRNPTPKQVATRIRMFVAT